MITKVNVERVLSTLDEMFPDARCELNHGNALELVIAVVLSAQCTDVSVNKVTPGLFEKYTTLESYLEAPLEDIEESIRKIGLYRNKAKFIKQLTEMIAVEFNGEVPREIKDLVRLPGVGRKTANVVVSVAYGVPALAVDTHVERISKRLDFCKKSATVLEVEKALMKKIPESKWIDSHHQIIFFGRYHCKALNPNCKECRLIDICKERNKKLS